MSRWMVSVTSGPRAYTAQATSTTRAASALSRNIKGARSTDSPLGPRPPHQPRTPRRLRIRSGHRRRRRHPDPDAGSFFRKTCVRAAAGRSYGAGWSSCRMTRLRRECKACGRRIVAKRGQAAARLAESADQLKRSEDGASVCPSSSRCLSGIRIGLPDRSSNASYTSIRKAH
jgi:hypothetical protein